MNPTTKIIHEHRHRKAMHTMNPHTRICTSCYAVNPGTFTECIQCDEPMPARWRNGGIKKPLQ